MSTHVHVHLSHTKFLTVVSNWRDVQKYITIMLCISGTCVHLFFRFCPLICGFSPKLLPIIIESEFAKSYTPGILPLKSCPIVDTAEEQCLHRAGASN